jgi:hypothetical protein
MIDRPPSVACYVNMYRYYLKNHLKKFVFFNTHFIFNIINGTLLKERHEKRIFYMLPKK